MKITAEIAELDRRIAELNVSIELSSRRIRRRIAFMRVFMPLALVYFWTRLITTSSVGLAVASLLTLFMFVPMFAWWHSSERDAEAA